MPSANLFVCMSKLDQLEVRIPWDICVQADSRQEGTHSVTSSKPRVLSCILLVVVMNMTVM